MTYKYGKTYNWTGLWLCGSLREDRKVNDK